MENGRLQRRIERLERENEHLKQQLVTERRAGRRQAAPFTKRPQGRGGPSRPAGTPGVPGARRRDLGGADADAVSGLRAPQSK